MNEKCPHYAVTRNGRNGITFICVMKLVNIKTKKVTTLKNLDSISKVLFEIKLYEASNKNSDSDDSVCRQFCGIWDEQNNQNLIPKISFGQTKRD